MGRNQVQDGFAPAAGSASEHVQQHGPRGLRLAVHVGACQTHEDAPKPVDQRREAGDQARARQVLRHEAAPAPLVLELVEDVLAVAAVTVELRESDHIGGFIARDQHAEVPSAIRLRRPGPLVEGRQQQLVRARARLRIGADGTAQEQAAPLSAPPREPFALEEPLPAVARLRPAVAAAQRAEVALHLLRPAQLEQVRQRQRVGLVQNARGAVAHIAAQQPRPQVGRQAADPVEGQRGAVLAGVPLSRQHVHAQNQPRRPHRPGLVVLARPSRLLRVVALLRPLLMPVERLDRVVHVRHVGFGQERQYEAVHQRPDPGVPLLGTLGDLLEAVADAVLRDEAPEAQKLRADRVLPQGVDAGVARNAVQHRQKQRPHHVGRTGRIVARVAQGGLAQDRVQEAAVAQILGEVRHAAQPRHARVLVPMRPDRSAPATQHGATFSLTIRPDFGSVLSGNGFHGGHLFSHKGHYHEAVAFSPKR